MTTVGQLWYDRTVVLRGHAIAGWVYPVHVAIAGTFAVHAMHIIFWNGNIYDFYF